MDVCTMASIYLDWFLQGRNGHEMVYDIARLNGHQKTPETICKVLAVHRARLAQVIREEMEATVL